MIVITRSELECIRDGLRETSADDKYADFEAIYEALEIVEALISKCEEQSDKDLEEMLDKLEGDIDG